MPRPTPIPDASFLGAYAKRGAYTDCYAISVPGRVALPQLIEAFYTTPLFKLERWVLSALLKLPSTDYQAKQVAFAESDRFAAWKVEQRAEREILLDAGQTRLWLSVVVEASPKPATTLLFGSAVVPLRPNGKFGLVFHALLGFHQLYSKLLLSATARRIASTPRTPNAA
jgi:Protein of unknown function (DUF2867)